MLAFFVREAPIWADLPTGQRGVAHPAPRFDEPDSPNFCLWTFTPDGTDAPTILCHVSDFESVGEGLEGIYRWMSVERCAEIEARDTDGYQSPALLRQGGQLRENKMPIGIIVVAANLECQMVVEPPPVELIDTEAVPSDPDFDMPF